MDVSISLPVVRGHRLIIALGKRGVEGRSFRGRATAPRSSVSWLGPVALVHISGVAR